MTYWKISRTKTSICDISLGATDSAPLYNNVLCDLADKHVPPRVKKICHLPRAPWLTEELRTNKRKKRQLERRYRRTNLPEDAQSPTAHYQQYCYLLVSTKKSFYMETILGSSGDQRVLFSDLNKLLHRNEGLSLPIYDSLADITNRFADHFTNKI